ncbi:hypothetical protein [Sorangium sp. So ce341]|uniref:hypothetical protein n=1 Tax=Sorangium sp. So ce341 TaxID=3133302 RepID=UPI003F63F00F
MPDQNGSRCIRHRPSSMHYEPPLHVHIAFAAGHPHGREWSQRLARWLTGARDVYAVPEANIPVSVWSDPEDSPPPDIAWSEAASTALVLLADNAMIASQAWRGWALRQAGAKRATDLLLTCTVSPSFANLGEFYTARQAIRLDRVPEPDREDDLVLYATHAITRWFANRAGPPRAVQLFISHCKLPHGQVSGRDAALALKQFVDARPAGKSFFDEVGISAGDDFESDLAAGFENAVVIVLQTDRFSSRYWCGWEVITAKTQKRPLLVVNALADGEPSSLGYLGKLRTIRWDISTHEKLSNPAMHRTIVASAQLELLRSEHDAATIEAVRRHALKGETVEICCRSPELATLPDRRRDGSTFFLLHPDPPLPRYELALFERQRPDVRLASVTQALAGCHAGGAPLASKRIAISISDPPKSEAHILGTDARDRLWAKLSMHLLAAGAELAYGGDLRAQGYTEKLLDLARSAAEAGRPLPAGVVHWYVAWPVSAALDKDARAEIPPAFEMHEEPRPKELDPARFLGPPPQNDLVPEHHFAWTLSMRDTRHRMAKECHARILVGGQLRGVAPWPGLLEELETSIGKPIYLIGGFGGMARVLVEALHGEQPVALTQAFQDENGTRAPLREYYEAHAGKPGFEDVAPVDLPGRVARLPALGVRGLNNGLTDEENARLFVTRDLTEMIALVLKGLREKIGD